MIAKSSMALILVNVLVTSTAQVLLKFGMSSPNVTAALAKGLSWSSGFGVMTNVFVLGGLALYFASAFLWLLVLNRVDVSVAYPCVALGFIVTMIFGSLFLGETLSAARITGALVIALGVFILVNG